MECLQTTYGRTTAKSTVTGDDIVNFLGHDKSLNQLTEAQSAFNQFTAIGVADYEIRHSAFLAWLLNPKEGHGRGAAFPSYFIELLSAKRPRWNLGFNFALDETRVVREENRIDLLLENHSRRFIILLENKVHSHEHSGQLKRYRKLIEEKRLAKYKTGKVHLIPTAGRDL